MFCCKEHNLNFAPTWHQVDMSCNTRLAPNTIGTKTISIGKARNGLAMAICRPMYQALGVRIYVAHFWTLPCAQNWAWHFFIHCATWVPKVTWCWLFSVSHGSIPTLVSCASITSPFAIAMFLWVQSQCLNLFRIRSFVFLVTWTYGALEANAK